MEVDEITNTRKRPASEKVEKDGPLVSPPKKSSDFFTSSEHDSPQRDQSVDESVMSY